MAKFSFYAMNPQGEAKSGTLEAKDRDDAYSILRSNGYIIKDLWQPLSIGQPDTKPSAPPVQERQSAAPALSYDPSRTKAAESLNILMQKTLREKTYRPDLKVHLSGSAGKAGYLHNEKYPWWIREPAFISVPGLRKIISHLVLANPAMRAILILVVLLSVVSLFKGAHAIRRWAPSLGFFRHVEIVIKGRVVAEQPGPGSNGSLQGLEMCFHFPDLPLDAVRRERDLKLDRDGNFEASFNIYSRNVPRFFILAVRAQGREEIVLPEHSLSGDPLECTLPAIRLLPKSPTEGSSL
jgi:hypothetical protein